MLRTRKTPEFVITHREVAQPGMIVIDDLTHTIVDKQFQGSYVKVQPTLKASQRASFDAKSWRQGLLELGAGAVIVAPIVVPDGVTNKAERKPVSASPQERLKAMLATMKASKKVLAAALDEALQSSAEAGL